MQPIWIIVTLLLTTLLLPIPIAHSAPPQQGNYPVLPECEVEPTAIICIVETRWTVAELEALSNEVTLDGDEITFVYEDAEADMVVLSGGIQTLIYAIPGSDLWAIKLRVENASAATFSYIFVPIIGNQPQQPSTDYQVWRGPDAPPAPPTSDPLQGTVETIEFESTALGTTRTVEVYLPPNHDPAVPTKTLYLADGYVVTRYAPIVEARILAGDLPPVILVGAYPGNDPTRRRDIRAEEYLPGRNRATFEQHADFFLNELITWAETTYGASTNREDRAVFGLSNGAAFASWMGTNHPEIFGAAIVFSQGWEVDYEPPADALPVRFYLEAGTLEPHFHSETNRWRQVLEEAGIEVSYHERVAGHDSVQWREEIGNALVWVFGTGE